MLFKEGTFINDVYEIDRFIGEGAFAEVYRVRHKFLGRQAMKVFKSLIYSTEEIEQKLGEAIILSRIGHPNIIRVFDAGITKTSIGQCGYFTMEYVAGGSLESRWRSYGPNFVPIEEAVGIIKQVCNGLAVAHAEDPPIIHRDIKPQNILVGYDAGGLRIRIADFGLAKKVNPLTLLASARGTPEFKPPECLSNADSCAADIWAIGATFYLLLTDHLPFPIESRMDFLSGECWKRPLVTASQYNARIDPLLDSIISKCLRIHPIERFPNAAALLDELAKWNPEKSEVMGGSQNNADEFKTALGPLVLNESTGIEEKVKEALLLSRDASKLVEAADLLEEAINKSPGLREKYERQLKLWRCGIVPAWIT